MRLLYTYTPYTHKHTRKYNKRSSEKDALEMPLKSVVGNNGRYRTGGIRLNKSVRVSNTNAVNEVMRIWFTF